MTPKLKVLKLANAVKVGSGEETFFRDTSYDLEFKTPTIIAITPLKGGARCYTTIYNTIYFDGEDSAVEKATELAPKQRKETPVKAIQQ